MKEKRDRVLPMYAHQRENWFPRLHAAAALAGTYTAFALLAFVEPKSVDGVTLQVLVPASILVPFFASFIAFLIFAPASYGLYWLMEGTGRRDFGSHCFAGVLCVALTIAFILFAGYVASLLETAPDQMEETGLLGQTAEWRDQLFLVACVVSGAVGGAAFYLARKIGSSRSRALDGGRS